MPKPTQNDYEKRFKNHLCTVQRHDDGTFRSLPESDPCVETRYALFVINAVEDMVQDLLHYRRKELDSRGVSLNPIRKIYQSMPNPSATAGFIRRTCLPE